MTDILFALIPYLSGMRKLVESYLAGTTAPPTVCTSLGIRMVSGGGGTAEFHYEADGRHANPMGTLHGGILCDLADGAMGMAIASLLEDGESFTTLELKTNFLRPVWNAKLRAKGRVVNKGRTVALLECDVLDEKERLVAKSTSTVMILSGDMAKGR